MTKTCFEITVTFTAEDEIQMYVGQSYFTLYAKCTANVIYGDYKVSIGASVEESADIVLLCDNCLLCLFHVHRSSLKC